MFLVDEERAIECKQYDMCIELVYIKQRMRRGFNRSMRDGMRALAADRSPKTICHRQAFRYLR
jgi:hypothetical protein